MHLLIYSRTLYLGGAERVAVNLANYWAEKGWQVTVVTLTPLADDFYQLHTNVQRISLDMAYESHSFFSAVVNTFRRALALRKVLKREKPNVALGIMEMPSVLLALAAWGLRSIVTIGTEHTYPADQPLGFVWETLRQYFYGSLHSVVTLTDESAAWVKAHTRAKKVYVIPNAVVWPLSIQAPMLSLPENRQERRVLLSVGRLASAKGFDILITAFEKIAAENFSWDLYIIGEGVERQNLVKQIETLHLADRVFLPGHAGNMAQWYESADMYVMSSRREGFPNSLLEAMAYALPVVSADCHTGPRHIIESEKNGLLVGANDVAALADGLRRLMEDAELCHRFSVEAVKVRERFSLPTIVGQWESLFEELGVRDSG